MQDGTWAETEYEVAETEIPELVMGALKSNLMNMKQKKYNEKWYCL